MSGIIAVRSAVGPIDPSRAQSSLAQMSHRGPDGAALWIGDTGRVVLGQTRLAVSDLSTQLPIVSEDGALALVMDGDLYAHAAIQRELEAAGHRFRTRSDAEVVLHLYRERGVHFLNQLRGEFALVAWDSANRQLFAARDRFGIKPLYYGLFGETLFVASEAKAIARAGAPTGWDDEAFFQACCLQYYPPDRSLFRGILQVPPGHYLLATDSSVRILKYWDFDFPTSLPEAGDERAYVEEFRSRFSEAVKLRLQADVPVAAYLSGGIDSCAIVAVAMQHCSKPIDCFTVSFEEAAYDELSVVEAVARHTGARLVVNRVTTRDLADHFADAVWSSEMPAVNGHVAAKYLLSRMVHAEGYRLVLTGEGADEVGAGYPHFRIDHFTSLGSEADLRALEQSNELARGILLPEGGALPVDAARRLLGYVPAFLQTKASFGLRVSRVLSGDFRAQFDRRDSIQLVLDNLDWAGQLRGRDRVNQSLYLWTKIACANYALRLLGDGTEMAHSVRGRLPFFDHHVVEFARDLPISMKIHGDVEKYVIRAAMAELLPDVVLRRHKHPFLAPRMSGSSLDSFIHDTLRGARVPFFDTAKVHQLLEQYPSMPAKEQMATDPVLMFLVSSCVLHDRVQREGAS